jgi:hypothetical protein
MRAERAASGQRTEVIGLLGRALDEGALALDDFDSRVVAVGTATYTADLRAQVDDLPSAYAWRPHPVEEPPPEPPAAGVPPRSGRAALILGLASVPLALCFVGAVLGLAAIVLSLRAPRPRPGMSAARLGRIFGIIGILLSAGAALALRLAVRS